MPISATGAATPAIILSKIFMPSSMTNSSSTPRAQALCDLGGAIMAADLFVVAKGQIDRSLGRETGRQKMFYRLEDRQHAAFVVHGAAPPDVAVGEHAGKRRMAPRRFRRRIDGDHVHMGHQQDRSQCAVTPLPFEEQALAADGFSVEVFVNQGKAFGEKGSEANELRSGQLPGILMRYRAKLHRAR